MSSRPSAALLKQHPFLHCMNDDLLAALGGCATSRRFKSGAYLWRQGDKAARFYLLRSGRVTLGVLLPGQGFAPVESVEAGDALRWCWSPAPTTRRFDARVEEPVRAFDIDISRLEDICRHDPALHLELLSRVVPLFDRKLQACRGRLLELVSG